MGTETVFTYNELDGQIWADYGGGTIRRGHLVGTVVGDTLDFRYVQLNTAGETSSGHCPSILTRMTDGRLRPDEVWEWESKSGSGTSTVIEI